MGLITGALTGVIDGLEKAGLARRVKDPEDRRKVLVEPLHTQRSSLATRARKVIKSLDQASEVELAQLTDDQLEVIVTYVSHNNELMKEQTRKLRDT